MRHADRRPPRRAPRCVRPRRRLRPHVAALAVVLAAAFGAGAFGVAARVWGPPAGPAPAPVATALAADLQARIDAALAQAASEGVAIRVTSGWRSAQAQQEIVDEAPAQYGSVEEAHRHVLPPELSAHVAGLAVDIGPPSGAAWLDSHGAAFGLCRVYANEPWHFEPLTDPGGTCPALRPDSSWGWE